MKYTDGEDVVIWFNTVGPVANIQETYEFTQLPFCLGEKDVTHHHESIGEALIGIELIHSGIDIHFKGIPAQDSLHGLQHSLYLAFNV